ncbi:Uncharacterised protein [Vibrio cholerae]|nr:Uncharacterised protein [Vibrio cholerae]
MAEREHLSLQLEPCQGGHHPYHRLVVRPC